MNINLKISQKGLSLVTVPLVVQILLLVLLSALLSQVNSQLHRVDRYRNIIAAANSQQTLSLNVGNNLFLYIVTKNQMFIDRYEETACQITEQMNELISLVSDNPTQRLALAHIGVLTDRQLQLLDSVKEEMQKGKMLNLYLLRSDLTKQVYKVTNELIDEISKFIRLVRKTEHITPEATEHLSYLITACITLSLLISILFIVVATYFYRGVTTRLNTLFDNTIHFSRGESLQPRMPGEDEIARLDNVFHDMASIITKGIEKERALLNNMLVGLVTIDNTGVIESTNQRIEELFGFESAELIGKPFISLFQAQSIESLSDFSEIKQKSLDHVCELEAHKKDGGVVNVELSMHQFQGPDGTELLANILDVTERHEVEHMKQQFVAMASHELRTPLTSIELFVTALADGVLGKQSDKVLKQARGVSASCSRLIALVNDLLDVEKMETGKIELARSNVSLVSILVRALDSVNALAESRGVSIKPEPTNIKLFADEDRLVQVLVNLLGNAIKFSPEGGTVKIMANETADWVEVSVTDDGPGVPEKYQQVIFERFQQIQGNETKQMGGTGLGLAISKAIIERHGGTIGVTSNEGSGSTFWFRIPGKMDQAE